MNLDPQARRRIALITACVVVLFDATSLAESPQASTPSVASSAEASPPSNTGPNDKAASAAPRPTTKPVDVDAASFKGVQPGHATRDNLARLWGKPVEEEKQGDAVVQTYNIEPFEHVRVTLVDDAVTSIVLYLNKSLAPEALAKQLQIDNVEVVDVLDDKGGLLGQAFPERGVLFGISTEGSPQVAQIVIEPIDAQPFLLRAENKMVKDYTAALVDVDYALKVAPDNARCHWARARILDLMGKLHEAFLAAERAITLEPNEAEYRLTMVNVLLQTADFDRASEEIQRVVNSPAAAPVNKARAYCQWGTCLAMSSARNYQQAIKHHLEAIKLAEPLAADPSVLVRRAAKQVLFDANLGVAYDVAWGHWQQKDKVVPRWLVRAKSVADDLVANEKQHEELRLRLYGQALAALAGVEEPPDSVAWSKGALQLGKQLISEAGDPARRQRLEWQLGSALADALDIEYVLGHQEKALYYGNLAADYLARSANAGQQIPSRDQLLDRVYYRIGAVYAVKRQDHQQAISQYEKAVALLERPVPPSAAAEPGRQGDTFVSIAVSYWEVGKRDESLRLTEQGVKLLEQAVEARTADKSALAVPYANLASMHGQLGNEQKANQYAELAAKFSAKSAN